MRSQTTLRSMSVILVSGLCVLALSGGCGMEGGGGVEQVEENGSDGRFANDDSGDNQANDADFTPPAPEPEDYHFSRPATVGHHVYVANETINSVAIIDSRNLSIETVLTGDRPTKVVGPREGRADDDSRVMTLNQSSATVTVIEPGSRNTTHHSVLSGSNRIEMAPGGDYAVTWYDAAEASSGERSGDPAAVSVVTEDASYQVSVGFNVRDVRFDDDGQRALAITDDGVSVLDLDDIDSDGIAAPMDLIPPSHAGLDIADFHIETTSDGDYVIAYRHDQAVLLVTEVTSEDSYAVELPGAPTDMEIFDHEDGHSELFAVLHSQGRMLKASVPDGLENASEQQQQNGEDENGDGDGDEDAEGPAEYDGFEFVDFPFGGPQFVELTGDGSYALAFTTVMEEKRAVLVDLDDNQADAIAFDKSIRGVLADERGQAFVVIHNRQPGSTAGLSPGDEEYLERNWGVTRFDIQSRNTHLILTDHRLDDAALWSPEGGHAKVYMTYAQPDDGSHKDTHRDVMSLNLTTATKREFRLPSRPDGMGVILDAEKVFINQIHPQGRMTFVDTFSESRQTITGYQLNAGIE